MDASRQAIVLADGPVGRREAIDAAWPGWCAPDPYVIAADGGARHAEPLGLLVDRWVGDGDSLDEDGIAALRDAGVAIERVPTDKDASDTELALEAALEARPASIVLVGALGGPRTDHALANLALLWLPEVRDIDVRLIGADVRIRPLDASAGHPVEVRLDGRPGDLVTLLPVGGDAIGIVTTGLEFPLRDETLRLGRSRGLSNRRSGPAATVMLRAGRLLVVETPATL